MGSYLLRVDERGNDQRVTGGEVEKVKGESIGLGHWTRVRERASS